MHCTSSTHCVHARARFLVALPSLAGSRLSQHLRTVGGIPGSDAAYFCRLSLSLDKAGGVGVFGYRARGVFDRVHGALGHQPAVSMVVAPAPVFVLRARNHVSGVLYGYNQYSLQYHRGTSITLSMITLTSTRTSSIKSCLYIFGAKEILVRLLSVVCCASQICERT